MFLITKDPVTALQLKTSHKFSSKELMDLNNDVRKPAFSSRICYSLWNIPCFCCRPSDGAFVWERLPTADNEREAAQASSWWRKGMKPFKKTREWSELVACPKWKTLIRRFNKNGSKPGKFHYDPVSYALNFDDGPGQDGQFEEGRMFQNFSLRYSASIPVSGKLVMDSPPLN